MIIKDAYQALEIDKKTTNSNPECHWDYLSLKIGGNIYRMVFEMNKVYDLWLLRQWMVNDKTETDVKYKFEGLKKDFVEFDCSSGLCGEREFEFCISYEFCLKPMGIPLNVIKDRKHNWALSTIELMRILDELKIKYEIILDSSY